VALTKVTEVSVLAIVSTASNDKTIGSAIDVSSYYQGDLRIRMGRATGTAFTISPTIRIQKTYKTSPTANDWVDDVYFQPALGASLASQAVSGTEAAGQTVITLAAGTNFAAGDYVFFHNTTLANSEWSRVLSVASADITVEEAIVNAQTGATCRDQAEEWTWVMDLLGVQKIRAVVDGAGSGQAVIVEVVMGAVSAL
jgi:hypothetical protein